ncbi:REP-associated tyrosine transposase [Cylindrospermopsis raciborskii]|uniref:REP-associated tyrosine transposase n=1 Tax=Cylindrospermopsis raciborskii TaxID=77022 RepID=UPI001F3EC17A|nr:transposase [Cylindrospermopsis raciborskii]UJS04093.1 transposase [Cylindrospermopsis raciborskii KLL07]
MEYRRAKTPGATYFFTLVTYCRRPILGKSENIDLLREAFRYVMKNYQFKIDAIVILPEHLHCLWTLPENDGDFSTRWRLIKSYFSRKYQVSCQGTMTLSQEQKGEKPIWQRRFWEHQVRDDRDFINHVEYIHYNPVRHGLVNAPKDWQYSSFHRYVQAGFYDVMWGAEERHVFGGHIGHE